jgi:hypothetical protein
MPMGTVWHFVGGWRGSVYSLNLIMKQLSECQTQDVESPLVGREWWNRDCNFEREIAVFSYPQAGVVTSTSAIYGNYRDLYCEN